MKNGYTRELRERKAEMKSGSGASKRKRWKWFESLGFLKCIEPSAKLKNVDSYLNDKENKGKADQNADQNADQSGELSDDDAEPDTAKLKQEFDDQAGASELDMLNESMQSVQYDGLGEELRFGSNAQKVPRKRSLFDDQSPIESEENSPNELLNSKRKKPLNNKSDGLLFGMKDMLSDLIKARVVLGQMSNSDQQLREQANRSDPNDNVSLFLNSVRSSLVEVSQDSDLFDETKIKIQQIILEQKRKMRP